MIDPRVVEQIIEDEALTEGLSDQEAQELVGWMLGLAEELQDSPGHLQLLQRLGREVARLGRIYQVPVEELIELVELAWEDQPEPPSMKA